MIISSNAIKHTLKCIAAIAFPDKECKVETQPEPKIIVENEFAVKLIAPTDSNVHELINGTACYSENNSYDNKVKVKAFFLPKDKDLFSFSDGCVEVNADIISVSFVLLSRYEELQPDMHDKFGRFLYEKSINHAYDFIDIPLVDEYAMLLRQYVAGKFPNLSITPRTSAIKPTHDIDFLVRFKTLGSSIKTIAGDLLVRKSPTTSWKSFVAYLKSRRDKKFDPYIDALLKIVKVSSDNKLDSCFYFKALGKKDNDSTYDVFSQYAKSCIDHVVSSGMQIGLHGSFDSYLSAETLGSEKSNLECVSGQKIKLNRQHFLRFNAKATPAIWQACGISNDSTLGFAEHEGFRCGTCHPFPIYDLENDRVTEVIEHPLIAMDTTLFQYRNLSETEALESLFKLRDRCYAVEGDFVFLWHNTTMFGTLKSWYENVYLKFIEDSCKTVM